MKQINRSLAPLVASFSSSLSVFAIAVKVRGFLNCPPSDSGANDEIPLMHRLAIVYLLLPVVIWLVGWFEWWFGVSLTALVALGAWKALGPARASLNWQTFFRTMRAALRPATVALLLIAFAWVMATAAGGVFDVHHPEWHKHRSIFLDLSRSEWPVHLPAWTSDLSVFLPGEADRPGSLLRYYLGYYMVPGLLGKWLGPVVLNWAVPLWTWCGVGLMLLLFTQWFRGWKVPAAAAILILFSGMDAASVLVFGGWEWLELGFAWNGWPEIRPVRNSLDGIVHKDVWVLFLSNMSGLMWIPQHFIAGGLCALLIVQLRWHERFLAMSGLVLVTATFWSPFIAIGLLPLFAVLFLQNGIRCFLRWQNLLLAPPLAALLFSYLSSGTGQIERGWIWNIHSDSLPDAMRVLLVLFLTEFVILVLLLLLLRPKLRQDLLFMASLATLLLAPLLSYGHHNDLVLRGQIPALFLLSYYSACALLKSSVEKYRSWNYPSLTLAGLLVAVLGIGVVTPLFELARANNDHDFGVIRYGQMGPDTSILRNPWMPRELHYQYVTQDAPGWFRWLLRNSGGYEQAQHGKGEKVIDSTYTVHREGRRLVYVRDSCGSQDVDTRFFLHVVPTEREVLPPGRTHFSYNFEFRGYGWRIGETCLAVRELPDTYSIGHVTTGQFNLERTGHSWLRHYFSDAYRDRLLAEAGEPIIRSFYEVYLHREQARESSGEPDRIRLLYFKPGCSQDDNGTRFFMHVIPRSADYLPNERKEAGYEELKFGLEDYGGRYGGDCFAVRDLPEYDILEIRTGQTNGENSNSWQGSFTLGN